MIIFKDMFTNDEVLTDAEPPLEVKDKDGNVVVALLKVQSRLKTKGGDEIDVGGGNAFGGAAEDEGPDDAVEKVNHLADDSIGFGYTEFPLDKATFKDYFKVYMKRVIKTVKASGKHEDFAAWAATYKTEAAAAYKYLLANFKELEFYMNKSRDMTAGLIYAIWEGEAAEPQFMYFTHGLEEERV